MFKKFMEIHTVVKGVTVYLWPFVFVAVVSIAAPLIDKFLIG